MSLNSSSLTPTVADTAVPPASGVWLRIALMTVAGFETLLGLSEFTEAFDLHDPRFRSDSVHPFFETFMVGRNFGRPATGKSDSGVIMFTIGIMIYGF